MKILARLTFLAAFLIMVTLPFDPLLNQRFLVVPVTVLCVTIGLFAMYRCTMPEAKIAGRGMR